MSATLVTIKQAAERLACSPAAIRKWMRQGRLPAVRLGRLLRFRVIDLDAVVADGIKPQGTQGSSRTLPSDWAPRPRLQ